MERVSHRWYRTWERWSQDEWNRPSRSDNYLMQIAQRVQQVLQKQPSKITLAMQKIPFVFKPVKPAGKELSPEVKRRTITSMAKAAWGRAVGLGRKHGPRN